jgi:hypothetical protein
MEELVKLITDNGISVICVAYMTCFSLTTMRDMNKTLTTMTATLQSISDRLEILEKSMLKRKNKDQEQEMEN